MSFTVNIVKRVRLSLGWLNDAEQTELGNFTIATIQRRIRGGVDVNDQPAPRLSDDYQRGKVRRGLPGIRDLTVTGAMLNNMQVLETGDAIRIGFPDPRQAFKAGINQDRSKMIGISRFDQRDVIQKHDELMVRSVAEIIQVIAA
jgi:S1-C subfamily serine protease